MLKTLSLCLVIYEAFGYDLTCRPYSTTSLLVPGEQDNFFSAPESWLGYVRLNSGRLGHTETTKLRTLSPRAHTYRIRSDFSTTISLQSFQNGVESTAASLPVFNPNHCPPLCPPAIFSHIRHRSSRTQRTNQPTKNPILRPTQHRPLPLRLRHLSSLRRNLRTPLIQPLTLPPQPPSHLGPTPPHRPRRPLRSQKRNHPPPHMAPNPDSQLSKLQTDKIRPPWPEPPYRLRRGPLP